MYDYVARFYSTVTGRFASADPIAIKQQLPQTIDRYSYVLGNVLIAVDPVGLSMVIVCGTGQNCEGRGADEIDSYFWYAMAYWVGHEKLSAEDALGRWTFLHAMVNGGSSAHDQLAVTGVAFVSTAEDQLALGKNYFDTKPVVGKFITDPVDDYVDKLDDLIANAPQYDQVDTLIGFSLGGYAVARFLAEREPHTVKAALLIEPAFESPLGYPMRDTAEVPGVRFVTLNGTNPKISVGPKTYDATGYLIGAINLIVPGCSEHCNHGESMTTVAMAMSLLNP